MTPEDFMALLQRHDWFYDYSDDHAVWQKGNGEWLKISKQIVSDPTLRKIYDAFIANKP